MAATPQRVPERDWGRGRYEATAERLLPAARVLVEAASPRSGERVLDLGSGTGNVALLAAASGAQVTAVDPSTRLLAVAAKVAQQRGLAVRCEVGEAAALPAPDGSVDCVLSNFALIFAPDAEAAVAELARAVAAHGRVAFTAGLPGGATAAMNGAAESVVREIVAAPSGPGGFAWHDDNAVRDLFGRHAMDVSVQGPHELHFTATSPEAFLDQQMTQHPMLLGKVEFLAQHGLAEQARQRMLQALVEHNEDPKAFLSTVRYLVFLARRR